MRIDETTPSKSTPGRSSLPVTICEAVKALRDGVLGAAELTEAMLTRADELDGRLGTYVTRMDESARRAAEQADKALASGSDGGPLLGVPIGVKDVVVTGDAHTSAQSAVKDPRTDGLREAPVVRSLREAGAIVIGKTTTMEYAIGLPDFDQPFPFPRNPWSLDRWAGGSSSGTANGLAGGLFLGGIGTDTGGSIRLPAAWCGITGLKPTFGRVPKNGVIPLALSYDTVGPMARDARDCALLLSVIARRDPGDPDSSPRPVDDYLAALVQGGDLSGLRVGVDVALLEAGGPSNEPGRLCRAAVEVLADAGADLIEISLPYYREMKAATEIGVPAEALAYYRSLLQLRWQEFGGATRMAIGSAALTTAADYVQTQRVRKAGRKALKQMFSRVDVVVTQICTLTATPVDALAWDEVLEAMQTAYWNASGYPAISVQVGLTSSGLPAGLQIAGKCFDEATVLRVAHAYQERTDHHLLSAQVSSSGDTA